MPKTRLVAKLETEQHERQKLKDKFDVFLADTIKIVVQDYINAASDDDDKIARSTIGLDQLRNARAILLIERAKAFVGKRKYAEAIADATKAIKYRPESADGYITASYIYSTQEKHRDAIQILESGLRKVPPAARLQLDGYYRAAKELLKQKVDFVVKLPTELAIDIFTRLGKSMVLVECVCVSKTWRNFLLQQCPLLWQNATIGNNRFNPAACLLPSISNHIRKLEVHGQHPDYETLFEKLADIIASKGSSYLYEIYIELPLFDLFIKYAMRIITPVQHQLKNIFFIAFGTEDSNQLDVPFPLDLVLTSCPNLENLELLFGDTNSLAYQPLQSARGKYRLKKLLLTAGNTEYVFERLIPQCPELEYLETYKCGSKILSLIDHYCPRFRSLLAGYELQVFSMPPNDDANLGLYDIQYDMDNSDEKQQLIPMVVKSTNTLVALVLAIRGTTTIDGFEQLSQHTFNRLEYLGFYVDDDIQGFGNIATRIIAQCPMLKNVALSMDVEMPDQLFNYLSMLPHLEKLQLGDIVASSSTFRRLFDHYSARKEKCTLKDIRISNCSLITDDVLNALSSIKTLESITFDETTEDYNVTPDGVTTFTRNLLALPNLRHTCLVPIPYISIDAHRQLSRINELHNDRW